MRFSEAIDHAIEQEMMRDDRVVVFGEDVPMVRRKLLARFGPQRIIGTPISESAFLGAAVGAAMTGLRPIAELITIDFVGVALSALLNEAVMIPALSDGRWQVPLVVRAGSGGGYGDAGQHEQSLWGMLAGIPGLEVIAPSTPSDAAGLMVSAIRSEHPTVFLEHKLFSDVMRESLGGSRRDSISFDLPPTAAEGDVSKHPEPIPIGSGRVVRNGADLTIFSVALGVHRSLEAAKILASKDVEATVVDLRTVSPLDRGLIVAATADTGKVLVVDEDYEAFGMSGEIAAILAESDVGVRYRRVATREQIPYARRLEEAAIPSVVRIVRAAEEVTSDGSLPPQVAQ